MQRKWLLHPLHIITGLKGNLAQAMNDSDSGFFIFKEKHFREYVNRKPRRVFASTHVLEIFCTMEHGGPHDTRENKATGNYKKSYCQFSE